MGYESTNVATSEPPTAPTEELPQTDSPTLFSPAFGGQGHSHFLSPSPPPVRPASPTEDAPPSPTLSAPSSATSFTPAASSTGPTKKDSVYKGDGNEAPPTAGDDPAPFAFRPYALAALVDPKTLEDLEKMGGLQGLCTGLGTSPTKGLSAHSLGQGAGADGEKSGGEGPLAAPLSDRQRVYGINTLPTRRSKSLLQLMWLALKDKVLILLSVAAVVSLALGIYQDVGVVHEPEPCSDDPSRLCETPRVDFVEGVAIIIAIAIVVLVGSLNDWQKERQFRALNEKKDDRTVKVIRDGREQQIDIQDVLVGDLAILEPGEIITCDGILVAGHNVRCDESDATGESDAIKKVTPDEALEDWKVNKETKKDPFIISGSKVLEGVGQYVVIAIGTKSFNGRIMMGKLLAKDELIAKIGGACGLVLFASLMIKFFVQLKTNPDRSATEKAMTFVQILIISVTLVVVAVPEGLPLDPGKNDPPKSSADLWASKLQLRPNADHRLPKMGTTARTLPDSGPG